MSRRPRHKAGAVIGEWTLIENLDAGGNGEAWRVRDAQGRIRVMKILYLGEERYERFKREVGAISEIVPRGFPALPIDHAHLPDRPSKDDLAYCVMPEATPIATALAGQDVRAKVAAVRQVAEALANLLAKHGRHHRDVKPANLYEYKGRFVLGDFGLVTDPDPETDALTAEGTAIGPWAFLPSEVLNTPPGMAIDWGKVDVYCLAMSLWCLARESETPPRRIEPFGLMSLTRQLGVPSPPDDPEAVEDPSQVEYRQQIRELDAILAAATGDDPQRRPTLALFAQQLSDWDEGIQFRGDFQAYVLQAKDDEQLVLGWLVSTLRNDPSFGLSLYDVRVRSENSPIPGVNAGRFSDAVDGLVDSHQATAERFPKAGEPWHWHKLYPTSYGVESIERGRVDVEVLPLLRALIRERPPDLISLSGTASVTVGELEMPAPELYYLLRYMRDAALLDFDEQWERGPGVLLLNLRVTRLGRTRVVA